MALFVDRVSAGVELADALAAHRGTDAVVVGIPRGGVVVAATVADRLRLPLAAIAVRKLGAPDREEYALGAIAAGVRVVDEDAVRAERVSAEQIAEVEAREKAELRRRAELFTHGPGVEARAALVVDDGLATGATAIAACRAVRKLGARRVVLAVPVAPARWHPVPGLVDDYVCPHREREFWAVGAFYDDFAQTTDAEVVSLLRDRRDEPRTDGVSPA